MDLTKKQIAVYGSGKFAENFLLNNPTIKVTHIFDTNKAKHGMSWNNFIIGEVGNSIEKILKNELIIVIASMYSKEIAIFLNTFGLEEGVHFTIFNGTSIKSSIDRSLIVKKFSKSMKVNEIIFSDFQVSESGFHVIGFSDNHVLKIEIERDIQKKNNISKEIEIIQYLNKNNILSCPKINFVGRHDSYPYFIIERKKRYSRPAIPDLLISLLEQKSLGIFQGDLKPDNIIFDGDICYLIDYDQAVFDKNLKSMQLDEFLSYIKKYGEEYYGVDIFSLYPEYFDYDSFHAYVRGGALKIGQTSLLRKQITTLEVDGFYHTIQTDNVYLKGARDSKEREQVLDNINIGLGERILDVGCNLGLLSMYMDRRGGNVVGIDLDQHVVKAAQMISNIEQGKAIFKNIDIDLISIDDNFDTVLLFSVLQHFDDLETTAKKISNLCKRIIIELSLMESGMKPINGEWKLTSKWNFISQEELILFLEGLFPSFQFYKNHGSTDRGRFIVELRK